MIFKLDLEPAEVIHADLFPAEVIGQSFRPDKNGQFRAIVTDNHFYVIADASTGPYLVIKDPFVSLEGSARKGYTVITTTDIYTVIKAPNCGCGSRLRSLHPFIGVPYVPYKA